MTITDLETTLSRLNLAREDERLIGADILTDLNREEEARWMRAGTVFSGRGGVYRPALTGKQCARMSGWAIAGALGIEYSGDHSPIPHGGFFYSIQDWSNWGYASGVDIADDGESIRVEQFTVNNPGDRIGRALDSLLGRGETEGRECAHTQIEACKSYGHCDYDDVRTFNPDTWREERIWGAILPWIIELAK